MEDLSRYYTLLRDPARRRIIEILGTQEKIGFKELSHFLTQDKQRKYKLNDRGKMLYRILKEGTVPPMLEIVKPSVTV